jgi:hypothetical protein
MLTNVCSFVDKWLKNNFTKACPSNEGIMKFHNKIDMLLIMYACKGWAISNAISTISETWA